MSSAHLDAARRQEGMVLPQRYERARSRSKLTDISGGETKPYEHDAAVTLEALLSATVEAVEHAKFIGRADRSTVQRMLAEFDLTMLTAMESVQDFMQYGEALTVDPRVLWDARQPVFWRTSAATKSDRPDSANEMTARSSEVEGPDKCLIQGVFRV